MRVRIVCYEDVDTWILGKFAKQLAEHLGRQGVTADISKTPDPSADINHHIIFGGYDGKKNSADTVMITHIDEDWKVQAVRKQLINAEMAICMSSDTMNKLAKLAMPRAKLCFVNPAQDGLIHPRKLVVGITSKVQPTGCKRETILSELGASISPEDFKFSIMGSGWEAIIEGLRARGIEVDYRDEFDLPAYRALMPTFDYYLYFGQDEGSMGFLDALSAGVKTIVTPQGFHLDATGGIVHAFNEVDELAGIFRSIGDERKRLTRSVASWTWSAYASNHLLIWQHILASQQGTSLPQEKRQALSALGVALNPGAAAVQTQLWRGARKAERVGQKAARVVRRLSRSKPS
jgi:hypothetical protein